VFAPTARAQLVAAFTYRADPQLRRTHNLDSAENASREVATTRSSIARVGAPDRIKPHANFELREVVRTGCS